MQYYIGQLRKSNDSVYMNNIDTNNILQETSVISLNPFGLDNKTFEDFALKNNNNFIAGEVYYLRFAIQKIPQYYYSSNNSQGKYVPMYQEADVLHLTLYLQDVDEQTQNNMIRQKIGTCTVPILSQSEYDQKYSSFSFIFSPRFDAEYLVFKIQRNTYDAIENPVNGKNGRTWLIDQLDQNLQEEQVTRQKTNINDTVTYTISPNRIIHTPQGNEINGECSILQNLIPEGINYFLKIGYQSRPGNLIVINKEPIRVGKSGIFELNNGINIKEFMIASPKGFNPVNIDPFLLDYTYQIKDSEDQQEGSEDN